MKKKKLMRNAILDFEQKGKRTVISEEEIGQGKLNVFDITGDMTAIKIRIPNQIGQKCQRTLCFAYKNVDTTHVDRVIYVKI